MHRIVAVSIAFAALLLSVILAADKPPTPVVLDPEDLIWTQRPEGVRVAVLQGDPQAEGPFTLRLQYPAGYEKGPHYHTGEAYVTVLEGSYFRAYGTTFDKTAGIPLKAGTFSVNPAKVSHYEWTTGPALIQVTAMGPWKTVYVDADGSPRSDSQ